MSEQKFDTKDIEKSKYIAAVGYLWVLFLVPLFLARKSNLAQASAKQGLVLFLVQAVSSLFLWIPILGAIWGVIIFFIIPLYAVTRTLTGSYWKIPVVHTYADRIHFD
jgi:uncharacterized membrane protein